MEFLVKCAIFGFCIFDRKIYTIDMLFLFLDPIQKIKKVVKLPKSKIAKIEVAKIECCQN